MNQELPNQELLNIAYQGHYDMAKHYSLLIFRGRVSVITISIAVWVYVLGIHIKEPETNKASFLANIPIQLLVSYLFSYVIIFLAIMKVGYLNRLFSLVASGKKIESESNVQGFFKSFITPNSAPFLIFDLVNTICMFGYFVYNYYQSSRILVLILLALPWIVIGYFFLHYIFKSWRIIVNSEYGGTNLGD